MKSASILIALVLVGGLVFGPMYVKGPTGESIMQAEDWVPEPVKDAAEAVQSANQAYRWKDSEGIWQFSDTRPAGIADESIQTIAIAEVMTLPKDALTGDASVEKPVVPSPASVLISSSTGTSSSGQSVPTGQSGQPPALPDVLAEIAIRYPEFKAISDAMAQRKSQPQDSSTP